MIENLQALYPILVIGLKVGIFFAILVGGIKLGWKLAPWIIGLAFILYLFG